MKNNKRIQLNKEEDKLLYNIFQAVGQECRLNYIYAICIIQNSYVVICKRKLPITKIHKWFLFEYIKNSDPKNVDFGYFNIASQFLKQKLAFDLNKNQYSLLEKFNNLELAKKSIKEPFTTLEKYIEWVINFGVGSDFYFNKINEFVN